MNLELKTLLKSLLGKFKKKCDDSYLAKNNVKTINGNSIVGEGNIVVSGDSSVIKNEDNNDLSYIKFYGEPDYPNRYINFFINGKFMGGFDIEDDCFNAPHIYADGDISSNFDILALQGNVKTKNLMVKNKVLSNLTPDVNKTYNLGSSVKAWKNIYLANDGLKFQAKRRVDSNGNPVNTKIISLEGDGDVELYYPFAIVNEATAIKIQSGKFRQYYPPRFDGSLNRLGAEAVNIEDGDIRFFYSDGSKAIDIRSNTSSPDGYFQIFYPCTDDNGDSVSAIEVTPDGKVVFNGLYHNGTVNEGLIINPSNCHLEFGNDATDEIATENPIIIIPDIPSILNRGNTVAPSDYDRIKIGGSEYVGDSDTATPVILTFKQANEPAGTIPKFCITKAGDVYYKGKLLDNLIDDKINVTYIENTHDEIAKVFPGGIRANLSKVRLLRFWRGSWALRCSEIVVDPSCIIHAMYEGYETVDSEMFNFYYFNDGSNNRPFIFKFENFSQEQNDYDRVYYDIDNNTYLHYSDLRQNFNGAIHSDPAWNDLITSTVITFTNGGACCSLPLSVVNVDDDKFYFVPLGEPDIFSGDLDYGLNEQNTNCYIEIIWK